jgi:branched-chain amino acid transport system permease protein
MILAADSVGTDLFRAVLQGTPPGTVYALVALGFVLAYKTSGVFNLAFGAQAYISAIAYFKLHTEWGWNAALSLLFSVVLLAPLLGFGLDWLIFRHLRTAPAVAKLVVTIGLFLALPAIADMVLHYKPAAGRTPQGIVRDGDSVFYDPFGVYAFSRNELVAMIAAVVSMVLLGALFRYSAIGLRMRAVVESPRMTELNGVAADRVSAFAWALSSLFAGLAGVLIAPRFNTLATGDFFNLTLVAIAAAAIGLLVSLPRALAGGLALGILIALFNTFLPRWSDDYGWLRPIQDNLTPALPFVVLFSVIVFVPSLRRSRESTDPLSGVDPPPEAVGGPAPDRRREVVTGLATAAALVAVAIVVLTRADSVWLFFVTQAVILSIVFLSINVITGLAGQISLAQGTFAAIGAFATFQLAERHGMSVLAAAVIGAIIASVVAAGLAVPLRRLSGIWIAIGTLAFAYFFDAVMVKLSWVGGQAAQSTVVPRPVIGAWDLASHKGFLVLATIVLAVVATVVVQVSSGSLGQKLRALRGSEVAAQSIGISPAKMRIAAFAISGFIAGLGGAFLAIQQQNVNYGTNFAPFATLFWLVIVVTIGCRSVKAAIIAGGAFVLFDPLILKGSVFGWILRSPDRIPDIFPLSPQWKLILFGLGTIQFARHPEGAIEAARRARAAKRLKAATDGDVRTSDVSEHADSMKVGEPAT